MSQNKILRSHRARVEKAKQICESSPENISIFDREAYVELLLLEDILHLYEYRLQRVRETEEITRGGKLAKQKNERACAAIINLFRNAVAIAHQQILNGNYKAVWSTIPEGALMRAAGTPKYMSRLRELAVRMLRSLSDEATRALREDMLMNEGFDEVERHEANAYALYDIISGDELEALIREVEEAIPDPIKRTTPKANIL